MTQKQRVLDAYRSGCRSTIEVAARTGIRRSNCSAFTQRLLDAGLLRRTGYAPRQFGAGKRPVLYEFVGQSADFANSPPGNSLL